MRIPRLGSDAASFKQFLALAARLSSLSGRATGAKELAVAVGGIDLIIFIRDSEIDTFVAAPGFRNAVPAGKIWKEFLGECVRRGEHTAVLPFQKLDNLQRVIGIAPTPDAVLAVVGAELIVHQEWLCEILPLVSAMLGVEQAGMVAAARARLAGDAVARAEAMAEVLKESRTQLQEAVLAAEGSRNAAIEANRAKSDFLATMSHELRTPLNAIGGYSQLLAMGIHGEVTSAQLATLDRIDRSQRHLLGLINDILNLARLEAGKIDYEIMDLEVADIISDIAPMIEPQLEAKGIVRDVRIAAGIFVKADREKVQQILLNLLSNAVKFTEGGGKITVTAGLTVDRKMVWISVADTGRGIPAAKIAAIFEPFTQVHSPHSRTEQGAGLGLAISRDLARGMNGEIEVTSKIGSGSTFVVSLPAAFLERGAE